MIQNLCKEFTVILCSYYVFSRILNVTQRKKPVYILSNIIFTIILTFISFLSKNYFSNNIISIQLILSFVFLAFISKTSLELSFSSTIIAFGISYVSNIIAALMTAILFSVFRVDRDINFLIARFIVSCIQSLLVLAPFRLKRLQKGMPFLYNKNGSNNIILYICLIALFSYNVFITNDNSLIYLYPVVLIFFSSFIILISWRRHITQSYLGKLQERHVNTLQEELKVQAVLMDEMQKNLDSLSKIIHKDNKLIPAMQLAVTNYLKQLDSQSDLEQLRKKGLALLDELNRISQERNGIVSDYEISSREISSTNVVSIDALMNYMLERSKNENVYLELKGSELIPNLMDIIVSESDLNTLLADLIENAIIAVRECEKRNILIDVTMLNGVYCINILDSGTAFSPKVLKYFGKKRITTHKDTNGSGIGLMTTYELIKKYEASFIVEEYENNELFTKKLKILFDQKQQIIIKSPRASILASDIKRTDLTFTTSESYS